MNQFLLTDESSLNDLNFLGLSSCPMRRTYRESLEHALQENYISGGQALRCYIPSGCHNLDNIYPLLDTHDADVFPDIFTSSKFDTMFKSSIIENFSSKSLFKAFTYENVNPDFKDIAYTDPLGEYFMYAALPVIIAVDKKKLGNLPCPGSWEDLLNPIYENNILLDGCDDEIFADQLLYYYKLFGLDGLLKLAQNTKGAWHPAKMAKTIGTGSSEGAAIYIIPWFFAKSCPRHEDILLIWPKEGAFLNPLFALVKKSRYDDLKVLIDFLTGVEFGAKCANNHFPSINPQVKNNLPEESKFNWLGWDFIRNNNIEQLVINLNEQFINTWKNTTEKGA